MAAIVKIDTRGRLVIPTGIREGLDLKKGDSVLLTVDSSGNLMVIPVADEQSELARIEVEFGDDPGSLAKVATYFAKNSIDLVMTESKSVERTNRARWDVIADLSRCKLSYGKIKRDLLKGMTTKVRIEKYSRDYLH